MADKKGPIPDELTIPLKTPIKMTSKGGGDETVYAEITLREPNVMQLTQFVKKTQTETAVEAMRFLIHIVSGVPMPVLDKVGVTDFYVAMTYMTRWVSPPDEDDPEGNVVGSQ